MWTGPAAWEEAALSCPPVEVSSGSCEPVGVGSHIPTSPQSCGCALWPHVGSGLWGPGCSGPARQAQTQLLSGLNSPHLGEGGASDGVGPRPVLEMMGAVLPSASENHVPPLLASACLGPAWSEWQWLHSRLLFPCSADPAAPLGSVTYCANALGPITLQVPVLSGFSA